MGGAVSDIKNQEANSADVQDNGYWQAGQRACVGEADLVLHARLSTVPRASVSMLAPRRAPTLSTPAAQTPAHYILLSLE